MKNLTLIILLGIFLVTSYGFDIKMNTKQVNELQKLLKFR